MAHYSTIVLGGGTMGSAAAWELAKRGEKALVLEQFSHVHSLGSHSGSTRIFRHAYAEGPAYIPYMLRADDLWVELEEASGLRFMHRVGGLELGAPVAGGKSHARRAKEAADEHGVAFDWMDADEARRRFPLFSVPDGWEAGYGDRSGFLHIDVALQAFGAVARAGGVEIREHEAATGWEATASGVRVTTASGVYDADRLIVTAGAWASRMLAEVGLPLEVRRKTLFWLELEDERPFAPETMPVWIADGPKGEIYGFPVFGQPGLKIARHDGGTATTPETLDRTVQPGEEADVVSLAQELFPGVTGRVASSAVCMYTMTPDTDFIVDRHPQHANVTFGAGFSGHGFKFATAVGETLVDLHFDAAAKPLPHIALERFRG